MRSAEERDVIVFEGAVSHVARGCYLVDAQAGSLRREIRCVLSGRLQQHHIRVIPGDRVVIEVTPFDLRRGRITYRGQRRERGT